MQQVGAGQAFQFDSSGTRRSELSLPRCDPSNDSEAGEHSAASNLLRAIPLELGGRKLQYFYGKMQFFSDHGHLISKVWGRCRVLGRAYKPFVTSASSPTFIHNVLYFDDIQVTLEEVCRTLSSDLQYSIRSYVSTSRLPSCRLYSHRKLLWSP